MANQSQHAGTIADPIPQRLLYKKGDKVYTVATGPSTSGPTTDVVEATDTRKGIAKLSDSITSTSDAATGVTAATPLAVKYVNDKVTAVEEKNAEQDKKLESVDKTLTDQGGRLDALEAGGSGGGGMSYVVTPKILTPTNGAVGQNTKITITGSGYENVFPTDARKHRIFELSKAQDFGTKLETKEADADSMKFDTQLDAQTKYYTRIKDVSQKEYRSNWSPVVEFTTGDVTHANTPVITLKGYADSPTDIGSGLTIEGGAYSVNDSSSDTHKATSWSIRLKSGRANVWESLNDVTNKTSIEVPKGTLQKSTAYVVTVIYHSTNFNDSSPAEHEFTTSNDFGTVQAPVITISGEPNKILETPSFSGGVFSCTRDPDTHESTEIQVIKSQDQSTVWTHTAGGTTSVTIPKGKLTVSTQYKVKMRYKGAAYGWSEWAEKDFTTAAKFIVKSNIGIPGSPTFGVGLAPEYAYKSVQLEPAPSCEDENNFQYGLYVQGDSDNNEDAVAMKWIPKFYIAMLQKNEGTVNLSDAELDALLPYVEVTKEQMKEAQRRSPHNAMVVAPADKFANETEANQHGFGLMRGFIDGGKEQDGFFISNTFVQIDPTTYFMSAGSTYQHSKRVILTGNGPNRDHVSSSENLIFASSTQSASAGGYLVSLFRNTAYCASSVFTQAIVSVLSLIQGQYATSKTDCAWYDSTLVHNFPKGITHNNNTDYDDPSVIGNSTNNNVFVVQGYEKTTHNGSITGITNVCGFTYVPLIGTFGGLAKLLKSSSSVYDISFNDNLTNMNSSIYVDTTWYPKSEAESKGWGGTKSCFPSLTGPNKALFGIISFGNEKRNVTTNEFGMDYPFGFYTTPNLTNGQAAFHFNGASGGGAGCFYRSGANLPWSETYSNSATFAIAYPRTANASYEGG